MPKVDSSKAELNLWIIRTGCPNYTIRIPNLDPETEEVSKMSHDELAKDYRTRRFDKPGRAAESLDYTEERAENMRYATADANGDFYINDGETAREVFDLLQNDPDPKPTLDPRSPKLPDKKAKVSGGAGNPGVTKNEPATVKTLDRPI